MTTTSNRLPILAAEAAALHQQVEHHTNAAAEKALAAGAALVEAKGLVGHGGWGAWLQEASIPERSARRYMMLHRAGFNSATVADLGIVRSTTMAAAAERLLPKPLAGKLTRGRDERCDIVIVTYRLGQSEGGFIGGVFFPHNEHENAWQSFFKRPTTLQGLAMFYERECYGARLDKPVELTAEEAEEKLLKLCCARIERHSWGNRLAAAW